VSVCLLAGRQATPMRRFRLRRRELCVFARCDQASETAPIKIEGLISSLILPSKTRLRDQTEQDQTVVEIAGIPLAIMIEIGLVRVPDRRAIVAGVAEGVAVEVRLVGIVGQCAIITGIANTVTVQV